MLDEMNHILIEGILFKKKSEFGRYKKLADILNLNTQFESLHISDDISSFNIDIEGEDFRILIKKLPLLDRIELALIGIVLENISIRKSEIIRKHVTQALAYTKESQTKLINPENHYAFKNKEKSKLDLLIENRRNEIISKNLGSYIEKNSNRPFRMDIAIVFGDAHMPYIYEKLKEYGFKWKLEKTIEIF